jgi:hypothetical protein
MASPPLKERMLHSIDLTPDIVTKKVLPDKNYMKILIHIIGKLKFYEAVLHARHNQTPFRRPKEVNP